MIKINLLGDTQVDNTKKFIIAGYFCSIILLALAFYVLDSTRAQELQMMALETQTKEMELKKWQKITKEVQDLETKEAEYNRKISIIANLKKSKIGPVRVLDDLNIAVPERAWLTEIKEEGGLMRIDGKALDNQTIALFMKDIELSDYFETVDLGETRQGEDRAVKIKYFTLSSKINYAGQSASAAAASAPEAPK